MAETASKMRTRTLLSHGRVQGVGFRWWTRREAARLGVVGTVRNLPDGTVEVVARGTPDQLERLEDALRHGPPMSVVDRVEVADGDLPPGATGFEIVD